MVQMGGKYSANARPKAVMILGVAFIIFGLTQSGIAYEPTTYKCGFLTIELDGSFGDWPANALWHKVTHNMGWDTPMEGIVLPLSDEDGSFEFACVAGDRYLYVAVKIRDDEKVVNESVGNGDCVGTCINTDCACMFIDGQQEAICSPLAGIAKRNGWEFRSTSTRTDLGIDRGYVCNELPPEGTRCGDGAPGLVMP